jgi:proteasome accessory factor B
VALLNLSAALWREGSLSHEARIAQVKLASFGVTMTESLVGYAPIISTRDPALARVRDAIEANVTIRFEYLKPGDSQATSRVVSPWALVNHEGRWHLHAHETSSDKAKTFLLRRIVSPVTLLTTPAAPASDDIAQRAIEGLEEVYQRQVATLVVVAPSDAWSILCAKRNTQASGDTLEVHYTDLDIFANELAALGNDVVVHSPAALVDAVVANLRMLVDHHGG